ncbi:MAG: hypothetical protein IJ946_04310 [Clostridia bacterium]|nr:hypothetical protein [Clostridia bacterium]
MMVRKLFSVLAIILSLFAIASLFLPIYSTNITDGEACNLIVKGYNLVEFSPWGGVMLLTPLVLLGLMLSKIKSSVKTIGLLGLLLLDSVALCGATSAAYSWITNIATGFVKPHMGHLIYALLLFLATVCLWLLYNVLPDKTNIKNFFLKKDISVEPVDYKREKFYWCNRICDFAKYKENGETKMSESVLCFATSEGYFAAFNDEDTEQYFNIEAVDDNGAFAFVMGAMPTGIYGMFYEGQEFLKDPDMQVKLRLFDDIDSGKAELRIPDKNGGFTCDEVKVSPLAPDNIIVSSIDGLGDPPAIGAAVMQGEELIAFITEYNAEKHEYKCVAAEMIAIDLCRKIYEHKVRQAMHERELYNKEIPL